MTRIVDLRLILDRDGCTRVHVDGRELVRAGSAVEALRFVAERLERRPAAEQLSALATAIGVAVLTEAPPLERETPDDLRRRENARARELCRAAGQPVPESAREREEAARE